MLAPMVCQITQVWLITGCNVALMEGIVKWGLLSESVNISSAEDCLVVVTRKMWRLHAQMLISEIALKSTITKRKQQSSLPEIKQSTSTMKLEHYFL